MTTQLIPILDRLRAGEAIRSYKRTYWRGSPRSEVAADVFNAAKDAGLIHAVDKSAPWTDYVISVAGRKVLLESRGG